LMDSLLAQTRVTLTRRQGQIVSLVSQGFKNKEIATAMGITEGTVKVYLHKLFRKLGMNDRLDMALYGLKNLFVSPAEAPDPFGPRSLPTALALASGRPGHQYRRDSSAKRRDRLPLRGRRNRRSPTCRWK